MMVSRRLSQTARGVVRRDVLVAGDADQQLRFETDDFLAVLTLSAKSIGCRCQLLEHVHPLVVVRFVGEQQQSLAHQVISFKLVGLDDLQARRVRCVEASQRNHELLHRGLARARRDPRRCRNRLASGVSSQQRTAERLDQNALVLVQRLVKPLQKLQGISSSGS